MNEIILEDNLSFHKKDFTKNNEPLVTVVTVVYNNSSLIEETIKSVINQKYKNIEYILIDGGSNDGTVEIIKKYQSSIALWLSESDAGIYDAMNKGINLSTGEWVIFINAGDLLIDVPSDCFSNDYDIVYGNVVCKGLVEDFVFKSDINWKIKIKNTIHHQSIFYRKNVIGTYSLQYKVFSDYAKNLSLVKKGVRTRKCDLIVSIHVLDGISNNKSSSKEFFKLIKEQNGYLWMVVSKFYFRMRGVFYAVRYFSCYLQNLFVRK